MADELKFDDIKSLDQVPPNVVDVVERGLATKMGWIPEEQYQGPKEEFIPAREFITNTAATFQVTAENLLGGTLNVYDYGYFDYERGAQTGTASFDYTVYDYDGLGNNTSATWTINVQ